MVAIEPFQVEVWMDKYENIPGVINISETCSASVSIDELNAMASSSSSSSPGGKDAASQTPIDTSVVLTYGPIRGSDALKDRIAAVYQQNAPAGATVPITRDGILVTQGAISANFLVLYSLVGPGDHVVCIHPTYAQLYAVPRSLGAEVSLWELKKEKGFVPDVEELDGLVKENTKMLILNNPNNPTGAQTPASVLQDIVAYAKLRNIILFCDEVYWPLFHSLATATPSVLALGYDRVVSTGSMSKTYALAGLRLGWVASRDAAIIAAVQGVRDYTTISVSQLDDQVARYALSETVLPALMKRNVELARTNLALLEEFVTRHGDSCRWVKPTAGTTALIQFLDADGHPVHDESFCADVIRETKVLLVPGDFCFGPDRFPGYVRVGYVCRTHELKRGLEALSRYLAQKRGRAV